MRNLFIKRNKSFVGCINSLKIYIEDPMSSELTINNVPCRKLGTIKNGEQKCFFIDDQALKVFVIADKLSKGYCNEFYNIPAGQDDVFLSGQCRYNPASGNAFRFDGVTDEEVLANRKKGKKRGLVVLLVAIFVGLLIGFLPSIFEGEAEPQIFTTDELSITLNSDFIETEMAEFDICYSSADVAVFAVKEDFTMLDGLENYTIDQYGELVLENNGLQGVSELITVDGVCCFEYMSEVDGENYYYFGTLHKGDNAFWIIQFTTHEDNYYEYCDSFIEWAQSVELK